MTQSSASLSPVKPGLGLLAASLLLAAPLTAWANPYPKESAPEIAKNVAAMLVAGRGTVAGAQKVINDPDKGDKGFTPKVVEETMLGNFEKAAGKPIKELAPDVQAAVLAVVESAKKSVEINQGRINVPGVAFKGYIPAVFGRETGDILKGTSGITLKQTTTKVRNEYNKPDEFESKILQKFEAPDHKKGEGYGEVVGSDYRFMLPIYIAEACLPCHGDPKGELDIAGKPKEGYKVGDLRGAISVIVPLK